MDERATVVADAGPGCVAAPAATCARLELATGVTTNDFVIDDAWVYLATDASVSRVAKNGGAPAVLDATPASYLATDGAQLFWSSDGVIRQMDVACDAGPATVLSAALVQPAAITLDATSLYAIDAATHALYRIARSDGTASQIRTFAQPMRVVAAGGQVLVSDWLNGIHVYMPDGTQLNGAYGGNGADFLSVSLGELFAEYEGTVFYASLTQPVWQDIAETTSAGEVAVDSAHAYWADASGIWRAPRYPTSNHDGVLIEPATGAAFVAVDDECLYYATPDRIVRIPK